MLDQKIIQIPTGQNDGILEPVRSGFPATYVAVVNDTASDIFFNIGRLTTMGLTPFMIRAFSIRSFDINQAQEFTFGFRGEPGVNENQVTLFFADYQLLVQGSSLSPHGDTSNVYITGGGIAIDTSLPAGGNEIGRVSITNFPASQNVKVTEMPAVQVSNYPDTQAVTISQTLNVKESSFASFVAGSKVLSTTGSQLSSSGTAIRSVMLQSDPDNLGDVFVGTSTAQPFKLKPGNTLTLPVSSLAVLYVKGSHAGDSVNYMVGG